jgi:hypothetical protein
MPARGARLSVVVRRSPFGAPARIGVVYVSPVIGEAIDFHAVFFKQQLDFDLTVVASLGAYWVFCASRKENGAQQGDAENAHAGHAAVVFSIRFIIHGGESF